METKVPCLQVHILLEGLCSHPHIFLRVHFSHVRIDGPIAVTSPFPEGSPFQHSPLLTCSLPKLPRAPAAPWQDGCGHARTLGISIAVASATCKGRWQPCLAQAVDVGVGGTFVAHWQKSCVFRSWFFHRKLKKGPFLLGLVTWRLELLGPPVLGFTSSAALGCNN